MSRITDRYAAIMRRYCVADCRGATAILFAIMLPVLLVGTGVSLDYGLLFLRKAELQSAADAAALAAAREFNLIASDKKALKAVAKRTAIANLSGNAGGAKIRTRINKKAKTVTVRIKQAPDLNFLKHLASRIVAPIAVKATARVIGNINVCIIALDTAAPQTLELSESGRMVARRCGVFANSTSRAGMAATGSVRLVSELSCSVGGYTGPSSNYMPPPVTDCPPIEDPLAVRPAPAYGGCDYFDTEVEAFAVTLHPGVYCGGLELDESADVTLAPGIYVIKDGEFFVHRSAKVQGDHVSFYFVGDESVIDIEEQSSVSLTAPKDGAMAGILFFEDRAATPLREHVIASHNARVLLGTIYLPAGILVIDAEEPIAQDSAYTAIIARRIAIQNRSKLIINADYGATDVPVPDGIGPSGGTVVLSE